MRKKEEPGKVCISSQGPDYIKIEGLSTREKNKIMGVINGFSWMTANGKGRLKFVDTRKKLPSPTTDKGMLPFWRKKQKGEGAQLEMEYLSKESFKNSSPSIIIQHLCGYNYSPENYRHEARRLKEFGFECMRSTRGDDGKFWEIWFLPGTFLAKGDLAKAIENKANKNSDIDKAIDFLCREVEFGTLDVSVQRACAAIEME